MSALQQLIDRLTDSQWELLAGLLLLVLLWRIGCQVVGKRPLAEHFPLLAALLDVIVLPMWVIIIGGLVRYALRLVELPDLIPAVYWWTALLVHLAAAWALGRVITITAKERRRAKNRSEQIPKLIEALLSVAVLLIAVGCSCGSKAIRSPASGSRPVLLRA